MLSTTKIIVTDHCYQRYAERVGDGRAVEDRVRYAQTAGRKMLYRIRQACPAHRELVRPDSKYWYAFDTTVVFVCRWVRPGLVRVITCWPWREGGAAIVAS